MPDLEKSPLAKTSRYGSVESTPKTNHLSLGKFRTTLMHTKNLYENGPNPFFSGFFNLMGTRMVQIRMAKSV